MVSRLPAGVQAVLWRSLGRAVSQGWSAQPQTDAWPSCLWQISTALDSSPNNGQGLMWFVFAALRLQISLITRNLYPAIQTDLLMRPGTVSEEYSSCCRPEFSERSHLDCSVLPGAPGHQKGMNSPTGGSPAEDHEGD